MLKSPTTAPIGLPPGLGRVGSGSLTRKQPDDKHKDTRRQVKELNVPKSLLTPSVFLKHIQLVL
jgi:hypothetical protein